MKSEPHPSSIAKAISSWPFLAFLLTLLLNDWWLKYAFPGTVTGKLSDFAGIAVVGILAMAIWPRHILVVSVVIATGFIWWKGPLSQTAIDTLSRVTSIRIGRTVDYSDLVALSMLGVCPHLAICADRYSLFNQRLRMAFRIPLFAAVTFGIMGTSVAPTRDTYSVRRTSSEVALHRGKIAEAIAEVMRQQGLDCNDCSKPEESAKYSGQGVMLSYSFSDGDAVFFQIEAWPNGIFFGTSGREKAEVLRGKLKSILAERFSGLEYVEPLKSPKESPR